MKHYYNEFDPHAAQWLRNLMDAELIPRGDVDERSIADVSATELRGYAQCHFFAGIGGWPLALQLAGWRSDRPVWTGSCPCQSFSAAGKRKGFDDERDLWPVFAKLIRECGPSVVFGEQVAAAIRFGWIDRVRTDMEAENYATGFSVLGAHSVGSPHIRQRLFWAANAQNQRSGDAGIIRGKEEETVRKVPQQGDRQRITGSDSPTCRLGNAIGSDVRRGCGSAPRAEAEGDSEWVEDGACGLDARHAGAVGGLEHATSNGRYEGRAESERRQSAERCGDFWGDYELIPCGDGKTRRAESRLQPLVDGLPFLLADGRTREGVSRAKVLKGIGNAIVPATAAVFIRAFMESQNGS